jgi:hypothetical protein
MLSPHSPGIDQPIRSNCASAGARPDGAGKVSPMVVGGEAWEARAGDLLRLKSVDAVMTAGRVDRGVERPALPKTFDPLRECIALDGFDLASAEAFTSIDCPEARMAGDNHHNNNKNNKLR